MTYSKEKQPTVDFKDTLNLPRTDFPIRSNPSIEDPEIVQRWERDQLYEKAFVSGDPNKKFIFHDGPPYANGHIHLGSAYNKILKDIATKVHRMLGYNVPVVPGWDCHGLPIESKVTKEHPNLSRIQLQTACRKYAAHWLSIQREEFKSLGIIMRWDYPYFTMSLAYESSILHAFAQMVADGYIERKNKTVPWCPSCQTVLANAEIEHKERKDPSLYVQFSLTKESQTTLFPSIDPNKEVNLLIWTTTPWTLPLNRAITFHPDAQYQVLKINNTLVVVGAQTSDALCAQLAVPKEIIATSSGQALRATQFHAQHPFIISLTVPLVADESVSLHEGTAFVHCAPGAGPIDYDIGLKNKLAIYSPITSSGQYDVTIEPKELAGLSVSDGQGWVIKKLTECNKLLHKSSIKHAYPHCWRCHNGLIFRATKQWFCDLSQNNLQEKAVVEIDTMLMLPDKSANRLKATIEGRLEWCLSRQRAWGVPIPALLCTSCDWAYTTKEFVDRVANHVAQDGIEAWTLLDLQAVIPQNLVCPHCSNRSFKKEEDILDVWFDSGISHFAVLKQNAALNMPADLYLEGKDQHRGWFQSSLLTSIALNGTTCTKAIVTHGFVVDAKGQKMSKSIGNVISPAQMVELLGTDGLRLWASTCDIASEAVVSDVVIKNVQEVLRKTRNVCRFLLSNLYDYDHEIDALPVNKLRIIDQQALYELCNINNLIIERYIAYDFTAVFHQLAEYSASLSSFYLDIIKDRLYVEQANGLLRRSAQTVCYYILDTLTKLMAPILSFTAEQISDRYQPDKVDSIHLQRFNNLSCQVEIITKGTNATTLSQRGAFLKDIRSAFLKAIEQKRATGLIKHPLEARVVYYFDNEFKPTHRRKDLKNELDRAEQTLESLLQELLVVSQVIEQKSSDNLEESIYHGLSIRIEHAQGAKCVRCWQWHEGQNDNTLCKRCEAIVTTMR